MLRKRSRPVTGTTTTNKQPTLPSSDHSPPPSPPLPENNSSKLTTQPFFNTTFEIPNNTKPVMSPSSVLETKPFFSASLSTTTPLWLDTRRIFPNSLFTTTQRITPSSSNKQTHSWAQPRIGIALIDDDNNATTDNKEPKQRTNLVVFGSNLRVQIPSTTPPPQPISYSSHLPPNSPNSPVEFGIKTPRSNFGSLGRNGVPVVEEDGSDTTGEGKVKGSISMEEMEQSEDYTCVISHGPIPKTTHIFGNCIVESCCGASSRNGGVGNYCRSSIASQREKEMRGGFDLKGKSNFELEPVGTGGDFLSFCHHCKKRIGHGIDIFMYRGEKAFCSQECRGEGMLFDGVEF